MGWSLDQVRDLDVDEFNELWPWNTDRSKPGDDDSIDMDKVIDAKKRAEEATSGSD